MRQNIGGHKCLNSKNGMTQELKEIRLNINLVNNEKTLPH